MSSVLTTAGQSLINRLRAEEQPLKVDRMIFAYIPGLSVDGALSREQNMPPPSQIEHVAVIEPGHKGYVDPDQVVYSVILGTDVGDFYFNWIGLVESGSDTVVAVSVCGKIHKLKNQLAAGRTGNCITRNFIMKYIGAAELAAINVSAKTWQLDWGFTIDLFIENATAIIVSHTMTLKNAGWLMDLSENFRAKEGEL